MTAPLLLVLLFATIRVAFESSPHKLSLHLISCYINLVCCLSYYFLWTGFSPVLPDVKSCLYMPQRSVGMFGCFVLL